MSAVEKMEGVRIGKPDADRIAWCERVGVAVPFGILYLDVTIRRLSDGVERDVTDDTGFMFDEGAEDEALHAAEYQFLDGNYGCDCNRALMFYRAGNEDEPEETQCGHSQYAIVKPDWLVGR